MTSSENAAYKLLTTSSASPTSGSAAEAKYSTNLTYNPNTDTLSAGHLTLSGNAYLNNKTYADDITTGSLLVNGNTTFVQSPLAPTPTPGDSTQKLATTEFVHNAVSGLSGAMHFRGTTTSGVVDGSTTNPITINGNSYTATAGDVVLREITTGNIFEYVWTGSAWEMLGRDTSFKVQQDPITDSTGTLLENTTANQFIYSFSQNANGEVSVKTKSLAIASASTLGGIKTNYSASGKNYAIKVDSSGNAYVNVPWANTTYTFASGDGSFTVTPSGGSEQTVSIGKPATAGAADTATSLATARQLWGQSFDGTANVSGSISGAGNITPTTTITSNIGSTSLRWNYGYFRLLYVSDNQNYTASTSAANGITLSGAGGWIDLTSPDTATTPHIDFKINKSSLDYQTRIESNSPGRITIKRDTTNVTTSKADPNKATSLTYNNRSIDPIFEVDGLAYVKTALNTGTYIANNSAAGGNNTGYYLFENNVAAGRLYVGTKGTAAVSNETDPPTYSNTTGITILQLGNSLEGRNGNSESVEDNAVGRLRLYGESTHFHDIRPSTAVRPQVSYLPQYYTGTSSSSSTYYYGRLAAIYSGTSAGEDTFSDVGSLTQPVYVTQYGIIKPTSYMFPVYYQNLDFSSTAPNPGAYSMSTTNPVTNTAEYGSVLSLPGIANDTKYYAAQMLISSPTGSTAEVHAYIRRLASTPAWSDWSTLLDNRNFDDYTVKKNGNGTKWGVAYYSDSNTVTSTAQGAANTALMGKGAAAPAFVSVSPSITITAGTSSAAPKVNVTVLGVSGTAQSITTATTGLYGVTKLSSSTNDSSTTTAATPSAVKSAYDLADTANTTANNHKYWANILATSAATYDKTPEVANIKINGNTSASAASTKNVQLTYDSTLEVLNFVFS